MNMAKTIHEFSAPSVANLATGPNDIEANTQFELKPALINASQPILWQGS
jgi:hypothetical protein